MGLIWKAMPLLSTLAALVIIVHSAEEDFEPDYRELRPRRYDTVTPSYEQPWRILNTESIAAETTRADWDVIPEDESLKRRRPMRKRKRRPLTTSVEDLIPQERQVYNDEYRPNQQDKFIIPQSGATRRRRKQFNSDETLDPDRPLIRKRGHKRKRPLLEEPWPSEFDSYRPNENTKENNDQSSNTETTESIKYGGQQNYETSGEEVRNDETAIKFDFNEKHSNRYNNYDTNYKYENNEHATDENSDNSSDKKEEDKSLSEISLEIQRPNDDIISTQQKLSDKVTVVTTTASVEAKAKSTQSLDPQTLKEILKRSNGKSLSEILQQHNLSLVDLLHGKEKAISLLQMKDYNGVSNENKEIGREKKKVKDRNTEQKPAESVRNTIILRNVNEVENVTGIEKLNITEPITEYMPSKLSHSNDEGILNCTEGTPNHPLNIEGNIEVTETTTKSSLRRRFPVGIRRKLRMKPVNSTTYKSPLSRDLIALTSRRYQINRNTSRSKDWKDVMPTMIKINRREESTVNEKYFSNYGTTAIPIPEGTTDQPLLEENKPSTVTDVTDTDPNTANTETDNLFTETSQSITTLDVTTTENIPTTTIKITSTASTTSATTITTTRTTEKPIENPILRPAVKASDLRRQAFNNRLKKKRLKLKASTTEATQEYAMKDIFGMANLVSASEFIAKVQPRTTISEDELDFTTLEDFITTEIPAKAQVKSKTTKMPKAKHATTYANFPAHETEEESAKIEIGEILKDDQASARLSKILMERNMTINELVEHRERGSSHIHLADIFHNASREPNPPEPFLSKSLIEPISKETYPLRALLEANLHDPTAKATSIEPNSTHSYGWNIPVVMDFGNNVNENGENMGIMSLFDNFTKILKTDTDATEIKGQSTTVRTQTPENVVNPYETPRERRVLKTDRDLVTWKEIIAMMHRGQNNNTNEVLEHQSKEISPSQAIKKIVLDDLDGDDGLIVLNDLQGVHNTDSHETSTSDEKLEDSVQDKAEIPQFHGVLNKTSNSAKSVTVATASILGIAMILFLLTYATFKWKQQRSLFRDKQTTKTDRIPTPVFENRKGNKNNSSTRSKSPMISSSIYTIDTLDTRKGNDSPEYMWDSLRKPFQ